MSVRDVDREDELTAEIERLRKVAAKAVIDMERVAVACSDWWPDGETPCWTCRRQIVEIATMALTRIAVPGLAEPAERKP